LGFYFVLLWFSIFNLFAGLHPIYFRLDVMNKTDCNNSVNYFLGIFSGRFLKQI